MPHNQLKIGISNENTRSTDINSNESDIFVEQFSLGEAIIRNDCILPTQNTVNAPMEIALSDYLNNAMAISLNNFPVFIETNHIKTEYIEQINNVNEQETDIPTVDNNEQLLTNVENAEVSVKVEQSQTSNDTNNTVAVKKPAKSKIIYSCHKCKAIFTSRIAFETHYRQNYDEPLVYTCQICEKQMRNKRSYQRHYNRHTNATQYKCQKCSKTFSHEKVFKQHSIAVHNLTQAINCTDCDQEFYDMYEFKAHCRSHYDQKKKQQKWQCSDCGKIMQNRSSLSMHIKIHKNDRQFGCMLCEQKFVQKINLINHVKAHNAIKSHSCKECGKSFVGQSQLLRHHTYHTNVRSFECEVCKKLYKTKRDLKLHLMVHSVQRPHKCSTCEKTFLSTSKLKQHLNIHTGSRPYKCAYCPKDFTNFPNWLKHTRRRHKVDHKTGEKLMVMPNFLSKEKKNAGDGTDAPKKKEKTKKLRKKSKDQIGSDAKPIDVDLIKSEQTIEAGILRPPDVDLIKSEQPIEAGILRPPDVDMQSVQIEMFAGDANGISVSASTSNSTDLSTITVNDKTLPLNTSDDLERAASLLMQQTLDLEDEMEFINIKSESIETSLYQNQYGFDGREKYFFIDANKDLEMQMDHLLNTQYEIPNVSSATLNDNSDVLFSYYPQSTQCDLMTMMMPLPPITTMKSKFKEIVSNGGPHAYSTTTNVL